MSAEVRELVTEDPTERGLRVLAEMIERSASLRRLRIVQGDDEEGERE